MSKDELPKYQKPAMRRMTPVSDREQVLLNFIRNQANRLILRQAQDTDAITVELKIGPDGLSWRIIAN